MNKENTIALSRPLDLDGRKVREIAYDFEEISSQLFMEAESRSTKESGSGAMTVAEFNSSFHLYLGYASIIAVNPDIDWADLARVKGLDLTKVMRIGRTFLTASSEEPSEESTSETQSGPTAESITPQKTKSEKEA